MYLHLMQASVTTYAIGPTPSLRGVKCLSRVRSGAELAQRVQPCNSGSAAPCAHRAAPMFSAVRSAWLGRFEPRDLAPVALGRPPGARLAILELRCGRGVGGAIG